MPRHTRYICFTPPPKLQTLADTLNAPRGYSEDYPESDGPLGLGAGTVPDDITDQPALGDAADPAPATHCYIHLSVDDEMDARFRSICDDHNASYVETDPSGGTPEDDGKPWAYGHHFFQKAGLARAAEATP